MDVVQIDPTVYFAAAFVISGICGLAAWQRSTEPYSPRAVTSSMLNGGCVGTGLALTGYRYVHGGYDQWLLLGVCAFAGLGGPKMADFFDRILRAIFFKFFADKGIRAEADEETPARRGKKK